jgi:hypothetical protein
MLCGFARRDWMRLFPVLELAFASGAKFFLAGGQLTFRFWAATALAVLRLSGDRLVAGPAAGFLFG